MYRNMYRSSMLTTLQHLQQQQPKFSRLDGADEGLVKACLEQTDFDPTTHPQAENDPLELIPWDWLQGLRLLESVPLSYWVPKPELLPPESIRFFELDQTWIDRLVDGAVNACNIGTGGLGFGAKHLAQIRTELDLEMATHSPPAKDWSPRTGIISGVLIRSELVRRWPEMLIDAFANEAVAQKKKKEREEDEDESDLAYASRREASRLLVLRRDLLSRTILVVLFAGAPRLVEMREPQTGTRFGVDVTDETDETNRTVKCRRGDGEPVAGQKDIPVELLGTELPGAINISCLREAINDRVVNGIPIWKQCDDSGLDSRGNVELPTARDIAIHLSQPPYVQQFIAGVEPALGIPKLKVEINPVPHNPLGQPTGGPQ